MFAQLKKILIPVFCIFHMTVIVWWTFPHSFAGLVSDNINQTSNDSELFRAFTHYYSTHQASHFANKPLTYLVVHQFELFLDLQDLPKRCYQTDKILWESQIPKP